jgi:ankyrin repeat protein
MALPQELPQSVVEPFVRAAHGDLATVKAMLADEPRLLNAVWAQFDETALAAASHMGQAAIANHLLAAGAPLTICAAAMLGQTDRVAAFLRADASQANATGAHGIPLLFHAALSGRTEIADLLLAHGGGQGLDAALHGATRPGHTAMARWLLEHGAAVNTPNFQGKTPLQVALEAGHHEIAGLLRQYGATE